jgi:micrococcal nuclease
VSERSRPAYRYRCSVLGITDGDTLDLRIDVGFRMTTEQRCRILDYNAPESMGPEAPLGRRAKQALAALLAQAEMIGAELTVETHKADSFGRYLADLYLDGVSVSDSLVFDGYGVRWDGRGKRPAFDPKAPYPLPGGRL